MTKVLMLDTKMLEEIDQALDDGAGPAYQMHPLAQDWARVSKVIEEAGEAIDELIGITNQNPRKGPYGTRTGLLDELADVMLTGLYAIQHYTKNVDDTTLIVQRRMRKHHERLVKREPAEG